MEYLNYIIVCFVTALVSMITSRYTLDEGLTVSEKFKLMKLKETKELKLFLEQSSALENEIDDEFQIENSRDKEQILKVLNEYISDGDDNSVNETEIVEEKEMEKPSVPPEAEQTMGIEELRRRFVERRIQLKDRFTNVSITHSSNPKALEAKLDVLRNSLDRLFTKFRSRKIDTRNASMCLRYARQSRHYVSHVTDVWGTSNLTTGEDVVMVSQLKWSFNKSVVLRKMLEHWSGPISIAIYINPSQRENLVDILSLYGDALLSDKIQLHVAVGVEVSVVRSDPIHVDLKRTLYFMLKLSAATCFA